MTTLTYNSLHQKRISPNKNFAKVALESLNENKTPGENGKPLSISELLSVGNNIF